MQDPSSVNDAHAALRVLIVEDEDLIRWSVGKALRTRGHVVAEARDGASGLATLAGADAPFDIVLLDYRLPDRRDLSLLEEVRRLSPGSAVFMMTAFGEHEMRAGAIARGARAIVDKPFRVAEFVRLIEGVERC